MNLQERLRNRSRDELIEIIERMISQAPELDRHLTLKRSTSGDRKRKEMMLRIDQAFVVLEAPWRAASAIALQLEGIADDAE